MSQLSPFEDVDNHVNDHVQLFHGYKKKLCRKLKEFSQLRLFKPAERRSVS